MRNNSVYKTKDYRVKCKRTYQTEFNNSFIKIVTKSKLLRSRMKWIDAIELARVCFMPDIVKGASLVQVM